MTKKTIFAPIFLILLSSCAAVRPAQNEVVLIHCGRIIDGVNDRVREDIDLIITNGKISSIGKNLVIPAAARRIDLSAYTVLPGLIDMHVHLTSAPEDERDLIQHMLMSHKQVLERARAHARQMLAQGFTTVRDLGSYHGWSVKELRDEIDRGETNGPRIRQAPFYLTVPRGGGEIVPSDYHQPIPSDVRLGVARGPEQFRARARDAVQGGADLLKVIASGAVLANEGTPAAPEMTFDEIKAVVDVAHAAKIKVAAHAHGAQSIKDALRAGVDTIEHASLIDDEGLRLAKQKRAALSMDIYNGDYIEFAGRRDGWPEKFLKKNLEVTDKQRQNFTRAYLAGVTLVYGTDAGVYPWGQNARQFKVMTTRGMKAMDAIKSATSIAARYLGWEDRVGSLTPNHFADLVAVKGDPLQDIGTLENVQVVILGGHIVNQSAYP